jgi:hypothetical protein
VGSIYIGCLRMSVERNRRRLGLIVGCGIAVAGIAYWYMNRDRERRRKHDDDDQGVSNRSTGGEWVRVEHPNSESVAQSSSQAAALLDEMFSPAALLNPLKVSNATTPLVKFLKGCKFQPTAPPSPSSVDPARHKRGTCVSNVIDTSSEGTAHGLNPRPKQEATWTAHPCHITTEQMTATSTLNTKPQALTAYPWSSAQSR